MAENNYLQCPKCKKKYHIKSGQICPHCKTDHVTFFEKQTKKKEGHPEHKTTSDQPINQKNNTTILGNKNDSSAATLLNAVAVIISICGLYLLLTVFYPALKLPSFFAAKGPSVTANTLYQDFQTNELKAINKYGGKLVTISGDYVDNGITLGQPWVEIGRGIVSSDVRCNIRSSSVNKATKLKSGQNIKTKGIVKELSFGTVIVDNCEL